MASLFIKSVGLPNSGNRIASTSLLRITWRSFTINGGSAATLLIVTVPFVRKCAQGSRATSVYGAIA